MAMTRGNDRSTAVRWLPAGSAAEGASGSVAGSDADSSMVESSSTDPRSDELISSTGRGEAGETPGTDGGTNGASGNRSVPGSPSAGPSAGIALSVNSSSGHDPVEDGERSSDSLMDRFI